jgi:hypothetical protein
MPITGLCRTPRPHRRGRRTIEPGSAPPAQGGAASWTNRRVGAIPPACSGDADNRFSPVDSWDLRALDLKPRLPEILSSGDSAPAIVLDLAAGESPADHELHERAWLVVVEGEVEVGIARARARAGVPGCWSSSLRVSVTRSSLPRGRGLEGAAPASADAVARQGPPTCDDDPREALFAPSRPSERSKAA